MYVSIWLVHIKIDRWYVPTWNDVEWLDRSEIWQLRDESFSFSKYIYI